MTKTRKHKLYCCTNQIDTEIHFDAPDITLYTSIKALKKQELCWRECGIYEVELQVKRTVKKPMTLEQMMKSTNKIIDKYLPEPKRKARRK